MNWLIQLKNRNIHTPKLAIARFLLAFGMFLTVTFNDIGVLTNHNYDATTPFRIKHNSYVYQPLKTFDIFTHVSPVDGKIITIVILLSVMSGYLPQVTGFLHVIACFSISNYIIVANGGDQLALDLSLLLLPICVTDRRLNQWRKKDIPHPGSINILTNVAFIVIQVQAAIVYLYAAISKIYAREWQDGTAWYYFTTHYQMGAPDWIQFIFRPFLSTPASALITWGIIVLELLLFACLLAPPKTKRIFLVLGLLLHFFIILIHGLISFFCSMAALLILFLDDENYTVKILARLRARRTTTA